MLPSSLDKMTLSVSRGVLGLKGIHSSIAVESYNFTYYEDLFAEDAGTPILVNVLAKSYRNVQLHQPGNYEVVLSYFGGETKAIWEVKPLATCKKAKNVIVFIGEFRLKIDRMDS